MKCSLFPYSFKFFGLAFFSLAFLIPILTGMFQEGNWMNTETGRDAAKAAMLTGLLILILSREKLEDEFVNFCRLKAFQAAFIAGIIYYLQDVFGTFRGNIVHSSFGLLMMEIAIYLAIFYFSKTGLLNGK